MPSAIDLSAIGRILQSIPAQRAANEQKVYDRSQEAAALGLKSRGLDIDAKQAQAQIEMAALTRALQEDNQKRLAHQNELEQGRWYAGQAPPGTRVDPKMLPVLKELGLGSQIESQDVPQLPSIDYGSSGTMPSLTAGREAGNYFKGTQQSNLANANLNERSANNDFNQTMREMMANLSKERLALAQSRPPVSIVVTSDGIMRVPRNGGAATPVTTGDTPATATTPSVPGQTLQPQAPGSLRAQAVALEPAYRIVDNLDELTKRLNTAEGPQAYQQGISNYMGAITKKNTDAMMYEKTLAAFDSTLARLKGEVGVLTDQDIVRARNMVPSRFDTKTVRDRSIANLRAFLDEKAQALAAQNVQLGKEAAGHMLKAPANTQTNIFGLPLPAGNK